MESQYIPDEWVDWFRKIAKKEYQTFHVTLLVWFLWQTNKYNEHAIPHILCICTHTFNDQLAATHFTLSHTIRTWFIIISTARQTTAKTEKIVTYIEAASMFVSFLMNQRNKKFRCNSQKNSAKYEFIWEKN